jgi:molybdate transport system ATP-binding protein
MSSDAALPPHLEVDVKHRIGTLDLAAAFRTTAPWTVLFGPSGSGKSTILRTVAGLLRPDSGRVSVLGKSVVDTEAKLWVEPHCRPIRWAGQRAALFPRKTVRGNLAAATGLNADSRSEDLDRAIDHFGLGDLANKLPAELSGGERQRVSVIRSAVGARGRLLLLDEPFAGLDAGIRDALIEGLRTWLLGSPVVSVTHDVGEAFLLGAEIVRIDNGRVAAQGPVEEVLAEERLRLRAALR